MSETLGQFSILYFAFAATYTTKASEELPAPMTLGDLYKCLEKSYPGIGAKVLTSCLLTINLDYVDTDEDAMESTVINEGDEVAIIPPQDETIRRGCVTCIDLEANSHREPPSWRRGGDGHLDPTRRGLYPGFFANSKG
ncbi:MAG: hypothetical protein Q9166_000859 [cf. Caloplaca sp. 2 TL-2023]